eukprot:1011737-Prorocentrum_minimum.AAC.1
MGRRGRRVVHDVDDGEEEGMEEGMEEGVEEEGPEEVRGDAAVEETEEAEEEEEEEVASPPQGGAGRLEVGALVEKRGEGDGKAKGGGAGQEVGGLKEMVEQALVVWVRPERALCERLLAAGGAALRLRPAGGGTGGGIGARLTGLRSGAGFRLEAPWPSDRHAGLLLAQRTLL